MNDPQPASRHLPLRRSAKLQAIQRLCTAQCPLPTPLGVVLLARTAVGLAGLWFEGQKHHPGPLAAPVDADDALFCRAKKQLGDYFAGRGAGFNLPLDLHGTRLQQLVWQALLGIAAGQTRSYGQIAAAVGSPTAVRAVAAAIGQNPVSILVPCHRVVGSQGALTGYAGGLERKRVLLDLEAQSLGDNPNPV